MEVKKTYNPDISKILRFVRERGYFPSFERYACDDYDIEHSLKIVTAIGQLRNPLFVIDGENRFAYENFIRWCHGDTEMKALNPLTGEVQRGDIRRGIYIAGNTGSGKSWCLEVMFAYARALGFQIKFSGDNARRPLCWSTARADEICAEFSEKGEIARFKKMAIIGIQDLGQEPKETLYMGNRLNVLRQLLEYRGDKSDELTIITSNLRISSDILREKYGDRVQSRLVEMCNYFEIKGRDRRKSLLRQ